MAKYFRINAKDLLPDIPAGKGHTDASRYLLECKIAELRSYVAVAKVGDRGIIGEEIVVWSDSVKDAIIEEIKYVGDLIEGLKDD